MVDPHNIELIIQFALLAAGQSEEYMERDLRPIHLIKYVYLADLEYAKTHDGKTFTGTNWQFYQFGPYANEVYLQIEPAIKKINAEKKIFPSNYQDKKDWCCYQAIDERQFEKISNQLPISITAVLQKHIREYFNNTPDLLNYVYNTKPMRYAVPDDYLDFTGVAVSDQIDVEEFTPRFQTLSKKKQLKIRSRFKEMKARLQEQRKNRKSWRDSLVKPPRQPRYDEVFEQGVKWLDGLAGEKFKEGQVEVEFDDSVWKSSTRQMDGSF